ncbi:MAG: phage minor head protein [Proteobacteria bacterium]|nr:phage minor head protein [Pseudomonadota bacterium]
MRRLNRFLPENTSINMALVDTGDIKAEFAEAVARRISETGVPVTPDDPVISSAIKRYAEQLNARFQRAGLGVTEYIWRSSDDERVRSLHREYDDRRFSWDEPPDGGHPGEDYNCRCFAEPVVTGVIFPEGATCDIINSDMLSKVFPSAPEDRLAAIAKEIDLQIKTGKLDSPERLAHFFGQVREESGDSAQLLENLNYNVAGLQVTFPYFRRNPALAQRFGRTADHPANREAIANHAYASRNGNGDIASGDGWRYRGRGLIHLTGRGNYRDFTRWHRELFGGDVNFEDTPDIVAEPKYAVRSALYFWVANELYLLADRGVSDSAINAITTVINRKTKSYAARRKHVNDIHQSEIFANSCRFSVAKPRFADQ